ncbi:helix-turn-helix domain-containing protein [Streptomyces sp. XD-27]|uniref:helix-turn-helix domain-containing protein n=1 Tax=Streptomyces sp. XD-27 TaxID=3062779 RepID=UPI0026F46AB2|nr:helix-turn-helix domain-containing protein [Streptomyces sp. XD-27]WKX71110.1 helix-turn-helix domain-containing protein [Streptomyces sp. XD-27]
MVFSEPEINAFLTSRRAALDPGSVGLPEGVTRRRVRGLRREEVAQLAGISVDYYTRIEQGRAHAISDSVLDAVARALRLTPAEHTYLRNITQIRRRGPGGSGGAGGGAGEGCRACTVPLAGEGPARPRVRPQVRQLLDALDDTVPAFVYGPAMDILAWNRLAGRVAFDLATTPEAERNAARLVFLHPDARDLHPDWEQLAEETVAALRAEAGRHPEDPRLCQLVGELLERSDDFRRHWEAQAVTERTHGTKRIRHPEVGELRVTYEVLLLPTDEGQMLCTYTAERGSGTERALRALAEGAAVRVAAR